MVNFSDYKNSLPTHHILFELSSYAPVIMIIVDFNNFQYHDNNYIVTHSKEKTSFNLTFNKLIRIRFFSI